MISKTKAERFEDLFVRTLEQRQVGNRGRFKPEDGKIWSNDVKHNLD